LGNCRRRRPGDPKTLLERKRKNWLKASLKGCLTTAGETLLELRAKKPEKTKRRSLKSRIKCTLLKRKPHSLDQII